MTCEAMIRSLPVLFWTITRSLFATVAALLKVPPVMIWVKFPTALETRMPPVVRLNPVAVMVRAVVGAKRRDVTLVFAASVVSMPAATLAFPERVVAVLAV
jgi:hypothetical protein